MRRMLHGLWLPLVMAAMPLAAHAQQTGSVQGTVTDQVSGAPLPGVQVFVVGTSSGTLTDENGAFLLADVPAGSRTVRAEIGRASCRERVESSGGGGP